MNKLKIGDKGLWFQNFSKNESPREVKVVGFSPSGKVIHVEDGKGNQTSLNNGGGYSFPVRGSHMGNVYVVFQRLKDLV